MEIQVRRGASNAKRPFKLIACELDARVDERATNLDGCLGISWIARGFERDCHSHGPTK